MFKGLFKLVFGLIKLVFFLVIFAVVFHTWVIKQAVIFSLSYQLGADVSVRNVKMDWKHTGFEIQGLEIGNPYSFPKGMMADIPLVIVSVDLPRVLQGNFRFKAVGFDLRELQVVNAPKKGLNLLALKPLQKGDEKNAASPMQEVVRKQIGQYEFGIIIEELIFSIGEISYLDMSGPTLRQSRYKAGIRGATYYDVRGAEDMTAILVAEALKKMGFGFLGAQLQKLQGRAIPPGEKSGFLGRALSAVTGNSFE